MMTEIQENEITDYLIFQKLPLDILLEVKDHMISQIADLQMKENVGFEEAFHKTKILWEDEFKMTGYSFFYSEPIPVIAKKILKTNNNEILKKSILFGLISLAVNLLLIYGSDTDKMYTLFFRLENFMFFLAPVIVWVLNYKILKFIRTDFKYKGRLFYTIYQQNAGLLVICLISMMQLVMKDGKPVYDSFRTDNHSEILNAVFALAFMFLLQTFMIFGLFNFFKHKKSLKKIQHFLQTSAV
ncbi:hypothetical protein [Chryseobacterium angstadtii]|uniref:hypothetical protein n=1 Tax=Chryseobacterium angstadtii TaxID=558151 RepID=UPI000A773E70|nr:hypothetical protein [Chryseobacterium angstadtii]